MKDWKSNAEWPDGVVSTANGDNITSDSHLTERAAEAVCERLKAEGLGGEGLFFPVRTWVSDEDGNERTI